MNFKQQEKKLKPVLEGCWFGHSESIEEGRTAIILLIDWLCYP